MNSYGNYADVALRAWKCHIRNHNLAHYSGVLSMHGLARLGKMQGATEIIDEVKRRLDPFWRGNIEKACGVFGPNVYRWGGNATAFLVLRGMLPEAKDTLINCCEKLLNEQPRDSRGIYHMPSGNRADKSEGFIWIDTVFGVCPFLLWTGLVTQRSDFIDEACNQIIKHHEILFDENLKIYHQAINFNESKGLTQAHWSRGCGWGALALAEMVYDLPEEHEKYQTILGMFRQLMDGCCKHMDENGMLHQTVEDHSSYVETSGTALVLYAISRGVKNQSLDRVKYIPYLVRGIKGISTYLAIDGSVHNCCPSCLAPNYGTIEDYNNVKWKLNDDHAFGPIIILFGQLQQNHNIGLIPDLNEILLSDTVKR